MVQVPGKRNEPMAAQGLEGVVVADTLLSQVDGERGRLVVRGYDLRQLAGRVAFDELCTLLWAGKLPISSEREALREAWGRARVEAFERIPKLGDALRVPNAMEALRGSMAQLSLDEPSPLDPRLRISAALAVFASAWSRLFRGESPLAPDPDLPPTLDYLRMVTAREPEPARVEALDTYLVAVADHGMNASTFTARIVASTASDPVSAVVAALGAFKGPLH
ncbi:MAG: citrate synthase/methylcitrate synthase, partial [Deltaproteobacteria bacterium]